MPTLTRDPLRLTIPRAELQAIADRHGTDSPPDFDATVQTVRLWARGLRAEAADGTSPEADDFDELADRIEQEARA